VQAQVEEIYFIFNLEDRYATLPRGMLRRLSTKSHAHLKPKYPSENQEKSDDLVWADELQHLVLKYRMFWFPKLDVLVFTG
jgi:hypothetical protein